MQMSSMPLEEDSGREAEPVVIESDLRLTAQQAADLYENARHAWPGRKVVVLDKGIRVSRDEQLDRIEAKLDRLLEALAEEEDDSPTHDLEGNLLPRQRDTSETL